MKNDPGVAFLDAAVGVSGPIEWDEEEKKRTLLVLMPFCGRLPPSSSPFCLCGMTPIMLMGPRRIIDQSENERDRWKKREGGRERRERELDNMSGEVLFCESSLLHPTEILTGQQHTLRPKNDDLFPNFIVVSYVWIGSLLRKPKECVLQ